MNRPLTDREAQFVRDNPQLDWPADTMAEAQHRRLDPMLPYEGWMDPTAPDDALSRSEAKLLLLAVTAAALGAGAIGAALGGWIVTWVIP